MPVAPLCYYLTMAALSHAYLLQVASQQRTHLTTDYAHTRAGWGTLFRHWQRLYIATMSV